MTSMCPWMHDFDLFGKAVCALLEDDPIEMLRLSSYMEEIRKLFNRVADKPLNTLANLLHQEPYWSQRVDGFVQSNLKLKVHVQKVCEMKEIVNKLNVETGEG